jgi:hypothetical protein
MAGGLGQAPDAPFFPFGGVFGGTEALFHFIAIGMSIKSPGQPQADQVFPNEAVVDADVGQHPAIVVFRFAIKHEGHRTTR